MINTLQKRLKRHINGRIREYFAITTIGFEKLCQKELVELGIKKENTKLFKGGVSFYGKLIDCLKSNLHLRSCNRILMRISNFKATNFRKLEKEIRKIPWELFLQQKSEISIKISSKLSRMYHSKAISEHIVRGISSKIFVQENKQETESKQTIFARIFDDNISLSIDSTGEILHKRGFKKGIFQAPIRETTASALLSLMEFNPNKPLIDPMCGSGTFALEAAMKAKNIPPGIIRNFAFMHWPSFKREQWLFLKNSSIKKIITFKKPAIYASDLNNLVCTRLKQLTLQHKINDIVKVSSKNFFTLKWNNYTNKPGSIILNPPYGKRMRIYNNEHQNIFSEIYSHLRNYKKWNLGILVPPMHKNKITPLELNEYPLTLGGLNLSFFFGEIK